MSLDHHLRQVNGLNYPRDLVYEGYGTGDMVQDLNIPNLKTRVYYYMAMEQVILATTRH
jgi:hypothetical protein